MTTPLRTIERVAARVLVVDPEGRVLLLRGRDSTRPERGTWWFTPGGGLDEGEDLVTAARRELFEETGLAVDDLGAVVFERTTEFDFEDARYHQTEHFFCVRTERFDVTSAGWTEMERRSVLESRWWSHAELLATTETIYPEVLADLLHSLLAV